MSHSCSGLVYVGGPIDLANPDEVDRRNVVTHRIASLGYTVYNPALAFLYRGTAARPLKEINDHAVMHSDIALLIFSDTLTIGTPVDMSVAHTSGIPVITVWPRQTIPAYITAMSGLVVKDINYAIRVLEYGAEVVVRPCSECHEPAWYAGRNCNSCSDCVEMRLYKRLGGK